VGTVDNGNGGTPGPVSTGPVLPHLLPLRGGRAVTGDVHAEGRRLVADIIRRKQEREAWAQWEQDKRDAGQLATRPAVIQWP
jgi:hypothetical protein